MVPTWASPGNGESGPHLGLTWRLDIGPQLGNLDPLTVFQNWTSTGPGDSGPPLGVNVPY